MRGEVQFTRKVKKKKVWKKRMGVRTREETAEERNKWHLRGSIYISAHLNKSTIENVPRPLILCLSRSVSLSLSRSLSLSLSLFSISIL